MDHANSTHRTGGIRIRVAREDDLPAVAEMVAEFVRGHPAENRPRPHEGLRAAYFGPRAVAELVVAEWKGAVVGMIQWTRLHDMFWNMYYGQPEWLFVKPRARGLGLSVALFAFVGQRVRLAGGEFLHGSSGADTKSLYSRFARSDSDRYGYYLSGEAFQQAADLAGRPPRDIVRCFPAAELSKVPARPRPAVV